MLHTYSIIQNSTSVLKNGRKKGHAFMVPTGSRTHPPISICEENRSLKGEHETSQLELVKEPKISMYLPPISCRSFCRLSHTGMLLLVYVEVARAMSSTSKPPLSLYLEVVSPVMSGDALHGV